MTITELASLARVSKGTVSRVLNNQSGVGPATRKRVQKLIDHTGYTPQAAARQLARKHSGNIALVIPSDFGSSGHYWSTMIAALTKAANSRQHSIMLCSSDEEDTTSRLKEYILSGQIDAVILFADILDSQLPALIRHYSTAHVVIGDLEGIPGTQTLHCIDIDNVRLGFQLAKSLLDKKARSVLHIAGPLEKPSVRERIKGFEQALKQHADARCNTYHLDYDSSAYPVIESLLKETRCDAIAISSGDFTLPLIRTYLSEHMKQPVAIFDDNSLLPFLNPENGNAMILGQDINRMAETAIALLITQTQGKAGPIPMRIVIPVNSINPDQEQQQ